MKKKSIYTLSDVNTCYHGEIQLCGKCNFLTFHIQWVALAINSTPPAGSFFPVRVDGTIDLIVISANTGGIFMR